MHLLKKLTNNPMMLIIQWYSLHENIELVLRIILWGVVLLCTSNNAGLIIFIFKLKSEKGLENQNVKCQMFVYLVRAGVNAFPKYYLAKVLNRPSFCISCAEVKATEISLKRIKRIDEIILCCLTDCIHREWLPLQNLNDWRKQGSGTAKTEKLNTIYY